MLSECKKKLFIVLVKILFLKWSNIFSNKIIYKCVIKWEKDIYFNLIFFILFGSYREKLNENEYKG